MLLSFMCACVDALVYLLLPKLCLYVLVVLDGLASLLV